MLQVVDRHFPPFIASAYSFPPPCISQSCVLSLHPISSSHLLEIYFSFFKAKKKKRKKTRYYDNSSKTQLELIQPFTQTLPGS